MARENIRLEEGNFTSDGVYYYSILDASQALQQKVDDGSVAFSYPLDTAVNGNIKSLEWDGVYFWSLEDRSGGNGMVMRKWAIESFICRQQQIFTLTDNATHTYDAEAMAVEHYRISAGNTDNGGSGYTFGMSTVEVSDNSMLEPGDQLTFVRRGTNVAQRLGTVFVEQATVQTTVSGSATGVNLTGAMQGDPHGDGKGFRGPAVDIDGLSGTHPPTPDDVFVTKNLWMVNSNSPNDPGTPALYKLRAANGSNLIQFSGTQFDSTLGSTFYTKYNTGTGLDDDNTTKYNTTVNIDNDRGGRQTYVLMARGSTLLFFNTDTNLLDRSMVMNNIKVNTVDIWTVYDMVSLGEEPNPTIFRLQLGTTYRNESLNLVNASWGTYNYEKQLLRRVVNSIAVVTEPSIIPADGNSTSAVRAILRDQYNDLVPAGKNVNWADDSGGAGGGGTQGLFTTQSSTDAFGVARNTYQAGTTEQDVKITASVVNGLIA